LTKLVFGFNGLDPETVRPLTSSSVFGHLEVRQLNNSGWFWSQQEYAGRQYDESIRALADSPFLGRLRVLNLGGNGLDDRALSILLGSPHLEQIQELALFSNRITDAGVAALAGSRRVQHLERLDLSWNAIGNNGLQELASSPCLNGLRELVLYGYRIDIDAARLLAEASGLPKVRMLWVDSEDIEAEVACVLQSRYPDSV
jgi:Ran GTPase-activating protein (RanGAP) involved in mRNA processing and transport